MSGPDAPVRALSGVAEVFHRSSRFCDWYAVYNFFYLCFTKRRICSVSEPLAAQHVHHLFGSIQVLLPTEVRPLRFKHLLEVLKTHIHHLTHSCDFISVVGPFSKPDADGSNLVSQVHRYWLSYPRHSRRVSSRRPTKSPRPPGHHPVSVSNGAG